MSWKAGLSAQAMIYNPTPNRSLSMNAIKDRLLDVVACPQKPFSAFSAIFSSMLLAVNVYLQKIYTQPEEEF